MTTYVLVHGAWGGSWGFKLLRPLLWQSGHEVFTPSLTGIGERSHLVHPGVDLRTHVADVVNTIRYEDLDDIVLLGFSYGGMVVTGCLDAIGDRVRHLVYLDAIVPEDGQSAADVIGAEFGATEDLDPGPSWLLPSIPRELATPEETAWASTRRSRQPLGTFVEPVRLSRPLEQWDFDLTFIKASADPDESDDSFFWRAARRAEESADWNYWEIATNHMVPLMKPAELADILLRL